MAKSKLDGYRIRQTRVRKRTKARSDGRDRLTVFRSGKNIYAQIIRDGEGRTLAAASTVDKELKANLKTGSTVDAAAEVGKLIAARAQKAGVADVYFDRGGYKFHGRIKALADAARESGLKF